MLKRRDVLKLSAGGLAGLALGQTGTRVLAADDSSVVIAYPADVPTWDPIATGSQPTISIFKCVFDKVLNLNPDLSFGPSIASSFRWLDDKGTALEFKVRGGVLFQNGDPLTADDIKFTFHDRLKAEPTLSLASSWSLLDAVEVPSADTAIFHFKSPFVTAPQLIADATAYVVPRKYFESVGQQGFIEKPIGSGPYRLVDYERDSRIVLEAFDKHWAGPAKIKRVTFQIVKDTSARTAAIQAGQVDFANSLAVRDVARLGSMPGLVGDQSLVTSLMLIHMVNKGVYRDPNVRLAMHHAIDKEVLSKAFFNGKAAPLSMWESAGMPGNDPTFRFTYDPAKAKELLAASGYGPGKPLKAELMTFNGVVANDFDMARAIVGMWKQVGIEAEIIVTEIAKYGELYRNDKIESPMLVSWFNSSGDPYIYSGVILDPKKRFSLWKSDDISPRLEPLFTITDYDKRIAGYRDFDRWVVEQGYALPLLQGTANVVHKQRLKYVPFRNGWVLPYYWSLA